MTPNGTSADDRPAILPILLVDDSRQDLELIRAALELSGIDNPLVTAYDALHAMDYLERKPALAAVVTDLKLPKVTGLELLRWVKGHPAHTHLPVVVLSSSREQSDIEQCYDSGANAYVVKPIDFLELADSMAALSTFWQLRNRLPSA